MLAQLRNVPGVEVIRDPELPFVLIALAPGFRGWVNPPFVGGGELAGDAVLDEELDGMFAQVACCEGPHGRSLSLDLDADIVDGLLGHPEVRKLLRLEAASWLNSVCSLLRSPVTVDTLTIFRFP